MRRGPGLRGGLALSFALVLAPALLPAQTADSKALTEAKAALAKAAGSRDFETRLQAAQAELSPAEAALLAEFAAGKSGDAAQRARILDGAADLRLLLGDYAAAAADAEAGAGPRAAGKLRAARLWLAAGEAERSSALAASVIASGAKGELLVSARLVSAWASLLSGSRASALALAGDIADPSSAEGATGEERREATFLLWVAGDEAERASRAKELLAAWPRSPEALIVADSPSVGLAALPHWYLGGLVLLPGSGPAAPEAQSGPGAPAAPGPQSAPGGAAPEAAPPSGSSPTLAAGAPTAAGAAQTGASGSSTGPTAQQTGAGAASGAGSDSAAASPPAGGEAPSRYQAGVFSTLANAESLVAELKKKGFSASIETKLLGGPRLYSVILSEKDNKAPLAERLRDSGYEIWLLDD